LLFISHLALQRSEARHDLFDGMAGESLRVKAGRLADELITFAKREREADAGATVIIMQFRDGVRINRITMDGVAAVAMTDGETSVARGNVANHKRLNADSRVPRRRSRA